MSELDTPDIIESSYNSDGSLLQLNEWKGDLHDDHDSCIIQAWDTKEKACLKSLKNPYTQQEIFYQDNSLLLINMYSGDLYNWDYKRGELSKCCELPVINTRETSPVFIDKDRIMAITHNQEDSTIVILDVETKSKLYAINIGKRYIEDVCISPDGRLLVVLDRTGTFVYDLKTAILVNTIPTLSSAYCLNISPDSKIVAIGTLGVGLDTYEIETGNLLSRCPEAYKISFSPDSRLMALKTDKKSTFEIRDVNSGCLLTTIHCKDGHLSHPSFSPDGNKILTSSYWGGKTWEMAYPSLSDLIKEVKKRFNNRELTEKEKEQFYLK